MEEPTRALFCSARRGLASPGRGRAGVTLLEILIAVAMAAALSTILLPIASRTRAASRSVSCLASLRALTTAFALYANDQGQLPCPAMTEVPWERSLAKYVPTEAFRCSGDEELAPATGSSYDWRDTGVEETTLANYPLKACNRSDAVLVFDALPSWHQKNRMNAAYVDGSAQSVGQQQCVADLNVPIRGRSTTAPSAGGPAPSSSSHAGRAANDVLGGIDNTRPATPP